MIVLTVVIDHETGKITKFCAANKESPKERHYATMFQQIIDAACDPGAQAVLEKIAKVKKPAKKARGKGEGEWLRSGRSRK